MTPPATLAGVVLFGTLRDPELLEIVLGRVANLQPVAVSGHGVFAVQGQSFPVLAPSGGDAQGGLLEDLSADEVARLDYYEAPYGYALETVTLKDGRAAQVYRPTGGQWHPGAPWSLPRWQAEQGPLTRAAAVEIMDLYGRLTPEALHARLPQIRTRAQARVNAAAADAPSKLRHGFGRDDVTLLAKRQPYSDFFAVDELDLRHRRFNGDTQDVTRAVFVMADAVVVLPYDPVRDRVLLIEQFRSGPYTRGDAKPWMIETIAGRVDGGESPETAVHREADEEAGVTLSRLVKVSGYYPSPGAVSEFLHCYVGLADLPDTRDAIGGLETEAEDIRAMVVDFDDLMRGIDTGEVQNGPLILLALWLARERPRLRAKATSP